MELPSKQSWVCYRRVDKRLAPEEEKDYYTNPEKVEEFVKRSDCDCLAIAVGTSHGAYKFSGGQGLQFHILEDIQTRLPGFPLVLHGASSVNSAEIERINKAGGLLKTGAKGVAEEELRASIALGICKVNIATDFRLLWTRVMRESFLSQPPQFLHQPGPVSST